MQCSGVYSLPHESLLPSSFAFHYISGKDTTVTALFATGGIRTQAYLNQQGQDVLVTINVGQHLSPRWQIHELPVDFSIDPKLRCRPEHVGRFLQHSGVSGELIYGVTTASLVLHSIVLLVDEQAVACGSIVPFALPTSSVTTEFRSDVFGRIHIIQWPGEQSLQAHLRACLR